MKMRLVFFACLLFVSFSQLIAQDQFAKNIYVEGLGAGLLWSANYDMRFQRGVQDGFGFRAGIGTFNVDFEGDLNGETVDLGINGTTFPLQVNYLLGSGRSSLELGAGITPVAINYSGEGEFDLFGETFEIPDSGNTITAFGTMTVGYRFQPIENGVTFRINWSPQIIAGGFNPFWGGLSLGYHFK